MLTFIQAVILGLVQGITEWVPVSSKTQVSLVYLKLFNGDPSLLIPILLYVHVGTVLAALIYFRREVTELVLNFLRKPADFRSQAEGKTGFLFTALLFTGIVGVPLLILEKKFFPDLTGGLLFALMGAGLLLTGFLLLKQSGKKERGREEAGWKDGILTGALQGLSVLPGVSRSGTSTTGLIWRGFDSESSFHLSFLLSIPTVVVAELIFYVGGELASFPVSDGLMLAGSSFVFGYLTIDALLKIVRRMNIAYVALALGLIIMAAGLLSAG
ncbi:Undecaprenyl-diphosphatase [Candidatus Burarchaeum australiense]|nr:Undecaprenyl-diphosphatase [Candidatus Burarchaeum australiense]